MNKKSDPEFTGRVFGYARVSTEDQNLDLQIQALERYGCDHITTEKASASKPGRKQIALLSKMLREGDKLVVWRLDRLGRNSVELQQMMAEFDRKGIHFQSLNESIDTSTAFGKLIFQIIAAVAEMEANVNGERTKAGMAVARERGQVFGAPRAVHTGNFEQIRASVENVKLTWTDIAKEHGVSVGTLRKYFKEIRDAAVTKAAAESDD